MSNDLELISSAMQNGNSGKKTGTAGNTTTLAATTPGKQAPTARSIPLNGNIRKPNQPRLSAFATEQEKIKDQFGANNSEEEESSDEEEPGNNAGMEASNGKQKKEKKEEIPRESSNNAGNVSPNYHPMKPQSFS
jgi:hypothetical protein